LQGYKFLVRRRVKTISAALQAQRFPPVLPGTGFIEFKSVLYTPHPSGMPTTGQASRISPADDFFSSPVISLLLPGTETSIQSSNIFGPLDEREN
jgi:hypothetical protein